MTRFKILAALAAAMLIGMPARGQAPAASPQAVPVPFSQGEVRKIDRQAGKITLKHGEITNLGMPPMAMAFQVSDPALLERFKDGDQVRFKAVRKDGKYLVTEIQMAKEVRR